MPIIISGKDVISTTGILPVDLGGTGANNTSAAINTLMPDQTGQAGKFLTTDGSAIKWATVSGGGASSATDLDGLTDVIITSPASGQVLQFNGVNWINTALPNSGGSGSGSVTSVDVSGGDTGLSFTGGPVVDSGTLVMTGTLNVENGGTGKTGFSDGYFKYENYEFVSNPNVNGPDVLGDIPGKADNVTGIVAVENGGTGSNERPTALNNLLPEQVDNSGKYLKTNGEGDVTWAPLFEIQNLSETTIQLANNETANVQITSGKAYILYNIETNVPAWVKVYVSDGARGEDSIRTIDQDPGNSIGLIAEAITSQEQLNMAFTPGVNGICLDAYESDKMYLAVTNLHGTPASISVSATIVTLVKN